MAHKSALVVSLLLLMSCSGGGSSPEQPVVGSAPPDGANVIQPEPQLSEESVICSLSGTCGDSPTAESTDASDQSKAVDEERAFSLGRRVDTTKPAVASRSDGENMGSTEASSSGGPRLGSGGEKDTSEGAIIYCSEAQAELSERNCNLIKRQTADLVAGMGKLDAPQNMVRDETRVAKFSIDGSGRATLTTQTRNTNLPSRNVQLTEFPVKVSRIMTAELLGDGLAVSPKGEQERDLGTSKRANWQWNVTAKDAGTRTLKVTVKAKALGAGNKPMQLDLYSEQQVVTVTVTNMMWIQDQLKSFTGLFSTIEGTVKAFVAILLAIGGGIAAWRALRKPSKPPQV
jgi:hypothetical protein